MGGMQGNCMECMEEGRQSAAEGVVGEETGMATSGVEDVRFHGRRKSRPLKPRQQRLMRELLPRLRVVLPEAGQAVEDACEDAWPPVAGALLDPAGLFAHAPRQVGLEIGFGGGEHLVHRAARHPEWGFIGCEPFVNGVAKLLGQIEEQQLANIRIWDDDARVLLPRLRSESIDAVWLLYPDPWPKKRHQKRRFVNQRNLVQVHRILKPGGMFFFASDIADYVRWTLRHVLAHGGFEWMAEQADDWRSPPIDWPGTRYEAKALREGRKPAYLLFRKVGESGADNLLAT